MQHKAQLITKFHPDCDWTNFLAQQINAAKAVLLGE